MHVFGKEEVEAFARVAESGELFRYRPGGECERFETAYAKYLGVKHTALTASGTNALTAALAGLEIGPGDEVLVPSFTYMGSAVAVLAVGAIPVVVDVDESTLISPEAIDDAVGPRTKAVMPVHMWGQPCDMRAVMRVARKRKIKVVEDACQGVCGGYEGKMLGSIGDVGAFSFNYFKNMTCGEGGAVSTNKKKIIERVRCMVDPCRFYWDGRKNSLRPFTANGARASEFQGAIMNVQLKKVPKLVRKMRSIKKRVLEATDGKHGLTATPLHSLDHECGTHLMYIFPEAKQAADFATRTGGGIAGNTGRHVYTEWDQLLEQRGGPHPALDPYRMPQNKKCRRKIRKDQCPQSLDILGRTVMFGISPDMDASAVKAFSKRIVDAAKDILEPASA